MENIWANTQRKWCHHVWVTMDDSQGNELDTNGESIFFISSVPTLTRKHDQIQIRQSSWENVSVYEKPHTQRPSSGGPFIQAWYCIWYQIKIYIHGLHITWCFSPCSVQSYRVFSLVEDLADVTTDLWCNHVGITKKYKIKSEVPFTVSHVWTWMGGKKNLKSTRNTHESHRKFGNGRLYFLIWVCVSKKTWCNQSISSAEEHYCITILMWYHFINLDVIISTN